MIMNLMPEPENLTPPFSKPEKSGSLTTLSIVVVVGFISLLTYYFYSRANSSRLTESSSNLSSLKSGHDQNKVKRKELIAYLKLHPHDEFAHFQLGMLIKDRAPFQALENLSHVTSQHPRYFEAQEVIADLSLDQDLSKQAKKTLLTLVRKFPEESRYHNKLARLFLKERNYDRSLKFAKRSIQLEADQAQNHLLVAEILKQAGRVNEMSGPLKQVLYLEPELFEAHLNLAYAALYTGDLETAEREARWCLEQQPRSNTALRYLAQIDRNRGKIKAAESHVDQALIIDPQDIESLVFKADLLIFQQEGQQAYDLLKPLYSENQTHPQLIMALSRAAGLIGKREEALQLQRKNQQLIKEEDLKPTVLQSETR